MDTLRFDGRVAVVTGAGRNLGRAYALALAERGARVVVNDLGVAISDTDGSGEGPARNPALDVVREIEALGGEAVASTDTVASAEGGAAIIATAERAYGRVDIVVNNAGVVRSAPFAELSPELVGPVLDTQFAGVFHVTRPAWRLMARQGYGRVVNVSSGSAFSGVADLAAYGGAKAGVIGLTRAMAAEGAGLGIRVNVIAPYAKTRPGTGFGPFPPSDELNAWMLPEFLAPLVALLAHEECPATGECFAAGAGFVSRVVLSTTQGLFDREMTADSLLRDWDQVMDADGMAVVGYDGSGGTMYRMMTPFAQRQAAGAGTGVGPATSVAARPEDPARLRPPRSHAYPGRRQYPRRYRAGSRARPAAPEGGPSCVGGPRASAAERPPIEAAVCTSSRCSPGCRARSAATAAPRRAAVRARAGAEGSCRA